MRASLVAQTVKSLPTTWETQVRFLGWEDPLEKEWQPTPVFLPAESHGQRSLMGWSMGLQKSQTQFNNGTITGDGGPQARSRTDYHILISVTLRKWQPTPMFWPGESQGRRILVGCHLWGHTELDTTEVT